MKFEFKVIRDVTFFLMNGVALAILFNLLNEKSTIMVILGIIGLFCLFLIDCQYVRRVILPIFKKETEPKDEN